MELVIVSGLSGSGKSIALEMLEDIGYYCIDNLPPSLLPSVLAQRNVDPELYRNTAIGVDARAHKEHIDSLAKQLPGLKDQEQDLEVIYLDCDSRETVRRYGETRRRHPLSDGKMALIECIQAEREMLVPIAEQADWHINTQSLSVHDLRSMIRERYSDRNKATQQASQPVIVCQSFGFKHGPMFNADFVFDLRALPNPYWEKSLRGKPGNNPEVKAWLEQQDEFNDMAADIRNFLTKWLPSLAANNRSYITIGLGCTGGRHRSVLMAETIANALTIDWAQVIVRHRNIDQL